MRYIDRITFVTESEGGYNPDTGNFDEAVTIKKTRPCNISPLGTTRTAELFGSIDKTIIVARLQRPHRAPFDYVLINGARMDVRKDIPHRRESVYYLEGVSL